MFVSKQTTIPIGKEPSQSFLQDMVSSATIVLRDERNVGRKTIQFYHKHFRASRSDVLASGLNYKEWLEMLAGDMRTGWLVLALDIGILWGFLLLQKMSQIMYIYICVHVNT